MYYIAAGCGRSPKWEAAASGADASFGYFLVGLSTNASNSKKNFFLQQKCLLHTF